MAGAAESSGFRWSSIVVPAYLPTLLYSVGEGGLIPLIPRLATELGSSIAAAGFIAGLLMVGTLVGDIPSGILVAKIGERNAMLWGAVLTVIGMLTALAASAAWMLGVGVFLVGVATAVFALARHAFLTTAVPHRYRARALSTLGGVFRAGNFIGPLAAAALIPIAGDAAVIWLSITVVLSVVVVLLTIPDPSASFGRVAELREAAVDDLNTGEFEALEEQRGLWGSLWRFRGVYLRVAIGAGLLNALRTGRAVALPLWAVSIGMDSAETSFWIGVAAFIDFALFYSSGQIMDRFGRLWGALPPMLVMSAGFIALSFSHDLSAADVWFIAITLLLGTANGFSSGVVLTLSSDLAPRANPAPFLGGWRFTVDACSALTPVVIASVAAVATLSLGVATVGVFGLVGAGLLSYWVPRYLPASRRR